jgi:transitional endoplasmic reticulum ATPase
MSGTSYDYLGCFDATPNRVYVIETEAPELEDYRTFLTNLLPAGALDGVDIDLIWRQASALNGHALHSLAGHLSALPEITTEAVLARLEHSFIIANVKTEQVEALSFDSLPGSEAIAAKLETHVMLPLENVELARRLNIRPKRGVLLYGPPGTGKTSIGRALAHRMEGRLFVIDGSFITEPPGDFFARVMATVQQAKDNAPSVLFIDDADVLFGIEHISGFPRYLLSLLDGVESETAGRVCLMMTAMNAERIPSSILRSGRVELWLETHYPDPEVREAILRRWMGASLPDSDSVELAEVAAITDGFTPADLRRIVGDAKSLYAIDVIGGKPIGRTEDYLKTAVANLVALRAKMADNLHDESLRITSLSNVSVYGDSSKEAKARRGAKYGAGVGGIAELNPLNNAINTW